MGNAPQDLACIKWKIPLEELLLSNEVKQYGAIESRIRIGNRYEVLIPFIPHYALGQFL